MNVKLLTKMNHSIYEYGSSIRVPNRLDLERFLISIRNEFDFFREKDEENDKQNFLSFDGNLARAKNYCGFIHTPDIQIDIWPKVFGQLEASHVNKSIYIQHILYWLSYCTKWKLPFLKNNLNSIEISDFPEIIISLMASEILKTISEQPIALYEHIQKSQQNPKGRINFKRYLSKGFVTGNHHILECDYAPFQFDNSLNRIIKYVTRILEKRARHEDTLHKLAEILFILDEVNDIPCSVYDLNKIRLNSHYNDYEPIIETCRIVLNQLFYTTGAYEQPHWCLLFPMELIFEDFIAGFIQTHFPEWKVEYQKSDKHLVDVPYKVFQLQHDILLTLKKDNSKRVIIDTKYKVRTEQDLLGKSRGVAQQDMYQMLSYSYRRGCNEVLLLYPNNNQQPYRNVFKVPSGFKNSGELINITAASVPFWEMSYKGPNEMDKLIFSELSKLLNQYIYNPWNDSID